MYKPNEREQTITYNLIGLCLILFFASSLVSTSKGIYFLVKEDFFLSLSKSTFFNIFVAYTFIKNILIVIFSGYLLKFFWETEGVFIKYIKFFLVFKLLTDLIDIIGDKFFLDITMDSSEIVVQIVRSFLFPIIVVIIIDTVHVKKLFIK